MQKLQFLFQWSRNIVLPLRVGVKGTKQLELKKKKRIKFIKKNKPL